MKIPILDELTRSVESLVDVISGDPEGASERWENYGSDSVLGTAGVTIGNTVAAGATAMVGETDLAEELINDAGKAGENLGATAAAAATEVAGTTARIATLGLPNPVSGALNEGAAGMGAAIDESADRGETVDWEEFGKETVVGLAAGAVSCDGMIPYVGKMTENAVREDVFDEELDEEAYKFDHAEEMTSWAWNLFNVGTPMKFKSKDFLKEVRKDLVGQGKDKINELGYRGVTSGMNELEEVSGDLSESFLENLAANMEAEKRKMEGLGFTFKKVEYDSDKQEYYMIFKKDGEDDEKIRIEKVSDAVDN